MWIVLLFIIFTQEKEPVQLAPRNHAYRISTLFKCIYVCQSLLLVLCRFQPNPRPLYTADSRFLGSQAGHENSESGLTMRDTGGSPQSLLIFLWPRSSLAAMLLITSLLLLTILITAANSLSPTYQPPLSLVLLFYMF